MELDSMPCGESQCWSMRCKILTVVNTKDNIYWYGELCSLTEVYRCFGGTYSLCSQDRRARKVSKQEAAANKQRNILNFKVFRFTLSDSMSKVLVRLSLSRHSPGLRVLPRFSVNTTRTAVASKVMPSKLHQEFYVPPEKFIFRQYNTILNSCLVILSSYLQLIRGYTSSWENRE
jgi:hypothetical protein